VSRSVVRAGGAFAVLALLPVACIAAGWPDWAEQAPGPPSSYQTRAPAVELLREETIRFDGSTSSTTTYRRVIQIRTREGRDDAEPSVSYWADGGKVKSLRAWIKSASGTITEVDGDRKVDAAQVSYELYNEARYRRLTLPDEADAGSLVAWEGVVDRRTPILQFSPALQNECPVLRSRVRLEMPPRWKAVATVWNHAPVEPARDGAAFVWELTDLPQIADEPSGIPTEARVPQIGISLAAQGASPLTPLLRWEDVSRWQASLADPQATVTPGLEAKARALTGGLTSPEEKVRAIARYVQGVNYISVDLSVSSGGGYTPHAAADVMAHNYGDCKDKANLMKAMLRAIGIDSYLVTISAVDPAYVCRDWPSPLQFNHCIIGVSLGGDADSCVADVPGFGPIAIFDPTDPSTPWGGLPAPEQGALALLVSARGGVLFRTPEAGPIQNHAERIVQAQLSPDGALTGLMRERLSGIPGSTERGGRLFLAREDFRKNVQDRIAGGMGGVNVTSLETDEDSTGTFGLYADFEAPRYGRPVAGFLSFRPVVAEPVRLGADWPATRTTPLRLRVHSLHETGRIRLPQGSTADEIPPPVVLETPFAEYRLESRLDQGILLVERFFQIRTRTIPAKDYPDVRRFFEQVRAAEAAPLLLTKG
jgi:Domain of Unknown Function with PDB structure (DUF3857)/Transglutaminase-like superfamily